MFLVRLGRQDSTEIFLFLLMVFFFIFHGQNIYKIKVSVYYIFYLQKSLEIFDKNSADKIWPKKDKEIKVSPFMPIRVKMRYINLINRWKLDNPTTSGIWDPSMAFCNLQRRLASFSVGISANAAKLSAFYKEKLCTLASCY